jgi:hypothetical protein
MYNKQKKILLKKRKNIELININNYKKKLFICVCVYFCVVFYILFIIRL